MTPPIRVAAHCRENKSVCPPPIELAVATELLNGDTACDLEDNMFGELFESFWWLLFPLGFFIAQGWGSFMRYKRAQSKIELLKTYAAAGKEPPADLVAALDVDRHGGRGGHDDEESGGYGKGGGVFLVVLFSGLSAVFAFVGHEGWLGGDDTSMYFVALILGVLALAFLASSLFGRRRHR